jgi:hypothetical protein
MTSQDQVARVTAGGGWPWALRQRRAGRGTVPGGMCAGGCIGHDHLSAETGAEAEAEIE